MAKRRATPVIEFRGMRKSYGSATVLHGIDLALAEHEVVCLIGASGSGKSTLLRCADLLEPIDAGSILLDGIPVSAEDRDADVKRRALGIVFQGFNLFPHMSVVENVALAPRVALGFSHDEADGRARTLSAWQRRQTPTPIASPAVSSSALRSHVRSQQSRGCSSLTRLRARSIPSSSRRSLRRCVPSQRAA